MTVSAEELSRLKSSGDSSGDKSLNGKLRISTEGVVFVSTQSIRNIKVSSQP